MRRCIPLNFESRLAARKSAFRDPMGNQAARIEDRFDLARAGTSTRRRTHLYVATTTVDVTQ